MFIHHLKAAQRDLLKNKPFSFINIAGMAISLASCFLIALFDWDELQYDQHHPHADLTYRVYDIASVGDGVRSYLPTKEEA
jgi:putative ABC transport system permease protein